MKSQKQQMNARSSLNNAFYKVYFILLCVYIYIYIVIKLANNKKLKLGSVQANTCIAELPAKRKKTAAQVQLS